MEERRRSEGCEREKEWEETNEWAERERSAVIVKKPAE